MKNNLMVLPSNDFNSIKVLTIPEDMERHEAFRYATGLIASFQENSADSSYDELEDMLEEKGFSCVEYILGPELDRR